MESSLLDDTDQTYSQKRIGRFDNISATFKEKIRPKTSGSNVVSKLMASQLANPKLTQQFHYKPKSLKTQRS